jgi:hypothetical protein
MRAMLRCLAAAACWGGCHAAHVKPYGICWTRNEASESHPALNLGNLLRSATSARRASEGKIPLCLFTNLEESTILGEAQLKYGNESKKLFDVVLQDSLATYIPRTGAEAMLLWPTKHYHVIRSRVGRLLNLARAPYEMTLFVDDDTYFCSPHGNDGLLGSIKWLHATRTRHTLRAQVFGHNGGGKECIWHQVLHENASFSAALEGDCNDDGLQNKCLGERGIQGGALAVTRNSTLTKLVDEWVSAFLFEHTCVLGLNETSECRSYIRGREKHEHKAGMQGGTLGDQGAFRAIAEQRCRRNASEGDWTLGTLPRAFNVREIHPSRDKLVDVAKHLRKQHSAVVDCRHDPQDIAVFGPLLMIHSKHYLNDLKDDALIEETCDLANRPVRKGGIAWRGTKDDNYMCS